MYHMYMYLCHFTQITLKIRPVFKILQKPRTILKRAIVATLSMLYYLSARLASANCTLSLYMYHYSLWTLFEVFKTHLGGQTYKKTENYQWFFCLKLHEIPILSPIDQWKDFWRRRQADGDDHWPVTVTSKNVFLRCHCTRSGVKTLFTYSWINEAPKH